MGKSLYIKTEIEIIILDKVLNVKNKDMKKLSIWFIFIVS